MASAPTERKSRVRERVPVQNLTIGLYQEVIDKTIARVKSDFNEAGVAETVLDDLRRLWEHNIVKLGVLGKHDEDKKEAGPAETAVNNESGTDAGHPDVCQPESAQQGDQAPNETPEAVNKPAPAHQPPVAQHAGAPQGPSQQHPQSHSMYVPHPGYSIPPQHGAQQAAYQFPVVGPPLIPPGMAHPTSFAPPATMHPSALLSAPGSNHPQGPSVDYTRKRSLTPEAAAHGVPPPKHAVPQPSSAVPSAPAPTIPQQDGLADDADAGPSASPAVPAAGGDDPLNAEDDDDDDALHAALDEGDDLADVDDHEEIDLDTITNVIYGQFDKVHRSKAKWRVNLKSCVATINGIDYVLKKINGEMNFS